ncbi:MAG: hypothetical protein HPY81_06780 [Firmicutes bacterium]|nr:hypothetical protein [Bacillota bacterium]
MPNYETPFQLKFLREEKHLIKPKLSVRVQSQMLFDVLFQYTKDEAEEVRLKEFIDRIRNTEDGIYGNGPFSVPLAELAYLEEGCKELELMGWVEVPVFVFELVVNSSGEENDEPGPDKGAITDLLAEMFLYNFSPVPNQIYVYPKTLAMWV